MPQRHVVSHHTHDILHESRHLLHEPTLPGSCKSINNCPNFRFLNKSKERALQGESEQEYREITEKASSDALRAEGLGGEMDIKARRQQGAIALPNRIQKFSLDRRSKQCVRTSQDFRSGTTLG
jgi:hypothetical protein